MALCLPVDMACSGSSSRGARIVSWVCDEDDHFKSKYNRRITKIVHKLAWPLWQPQSFYSIAYSSDSSSSDRHPDSLRRSLLQPLLLPISFSVSIVAVYMVTNNSSSSSSSSRRSDSRNLFPNRESASEFTLSTLKRILILSLYSSSSPFRHFNEQPRPPASARRCCCVCCCCSRPHNHQH